MRFPVTLRPLRAGAAGAGAALLLAVVQHSRAGGALPDPLTLLLALAPLTLVMAAALRQGSAALVAATLGGSQLGLHLYFRSAAEHPQAHAAPAAPNTTHAEHFVAATGLTPSMIGAHLAAALGTALFLAYGERVLDALYALLTPWALPAPILPTPADRQAAGLEGGIRLPGRPPMASGLSRRGPPRHRTA